MPRCWTALVIDTYQVSEPAVELGDVRRFDDDDRIELEALDRGRRDEGDRVVAGKTGAADPVGR